jgi:aspartyl/asparaginyl beta-hydroxylase (cupin superfamily)
MISLTARDADLRVVAEAYIHERETGALDYPAFVAAVDAYRARHPETSNGDASLIVSNLMQEMPRANNV